MSRQPQTKKQRATAWTDLCRLILCGVGAASIAISTIGFLDEDRPWDLAAMLFCVTFGVVLIGIGVFAKPKTVARVTDSISTGLQ